MSKKKKKLYDDKYDCERPDSVRPIPVRPIPARPIPVRPIPARPIPARPIPVRPTPVGPIPVRPEAEQPQAVRPEPRPEIARPEPTRIEPEQPEIVQSERPEIVQSEPERPRGANRRILAAHIEPADRRARTPNVSNTAAPPKKDRKKRLLRTLLLIFILIVALLGTYWMVKTAYMDNDHFEISFYRVSGTKLKTNMRTVLVSDLHMANFGENNSDLLGAIARLKPDFICVTGDLNTYGQSGGLEYISGLCENLVAIAPVYYALGNHEVSAIVFGDQDVKSVLGDAGVTLLNNKVVTATINANTVSIGGLTQLYSQRAEYAPDFMDSIVGAEGYRILLTHYPESFLDGLRNEDVDLAMCGHAHGGQIRLPFIGALYTPDQGILPKLTEGAHEYSHMTLVVSRGLGNSGIIPRMNNKPELVVIDMSTY